MKFLILVSTVLLLFGTQETTAQINVHTEDLPRFYEAFDKVLSTTDSVKQVEFLQKIYIDKASNGLKDIIAMRQINVSDFRKFILDNKQSLSEKRPWIMSVLKQQALIEDKITIFKKLYPDFREGDIYFIVGNNNTGGTIRDKTVYIGTEVISSSQENWAVPTVLHEFTHTQQWTQRNIIRLMSSDSLVKDYMGTHTQLLGRSIEEGMADFVGELVNGTSLAKTNPGGHTAFGLQNEKQIWEAFKKEMLLPFDQKMGWIWGKREFNGKSVDDLGYFVGHQICKSYYNNAKNKELALKEMLATNLTDENAKKFLIASGYLTKEESEQLK